MLNYAPALTHIVVGEPILAVSSTTRTQHKTKTARMYMICGFDIDDLLFNIYYYLKYNQEVLKFSRERGTGKFRGTGRAVNFRHREEEA